MLRLIWKNINSIKYKFLLSTTILLFVFISITIYFWYTISTNNAQESATTYMNQLLDISNQNLEVAMKDINSIISILSADYPSNYEFHNILLKKEYASEREQFDDQLTMRNLLISLSNNKYYLNGLTIFNPDGQYFTSGITMSFDNLKTQSWYSQIIQSQGERVFIPPHHYNKNIVNKSKINSKDLVFSYAKAIISDNTIIGFIMADVRYDILSNIFDTTNITDKGYIFVADTKSNQLVFDPVSKSAPQFDTNTLANILSNATQTKGSFYTNISGKDFIVVYSQSSFTNWITLGVIPKDILLSSFYDTRNHLLTLTIILSCIALFILFIMTSVLTKNILLLTNAVTQIDAEHLTLNIDINSQDEIGQLYHQIQSMLSRITELISTIKRKEKEKTKVEIRLLQSQINPHFLYNTLNTIKFIGSLNQMGNIVNISESLSTLLRINMDSRIFISIKEEVKYITSYLDIQKFKYNNLIYNIILEEDVDELMTIKLLLQPIVENSLLHGLSSHTDTTIINIKIYREFDNLKIRVQDNGIGMDKNTIEGILNDSIHSKGIGLSNVISRIKMYFGESYGISIVSQKKMFTIIEITIPTITKDKVINYD